MWIKLDKNISSGKGLLKVKCLQTGRNQVGIWKDYDIFVLIILIILNRIFILFH